MIVQPNTQPDVFESTESSVLVEFFIHWTIHNTRPCPISIVRDMSYSGCTVCVCIRLPRIAPRELKRHNRVRRTSCECSSMHSLNNLENAFCLCLPPSILSIRDLTPLIPEAEIKWIGACTLTKPTAWVTPLQLHFRHVGSQSSKSA